MGHETETRAMRSLIIAIRDGFTPAARRAARSMRMLETSLRRAMKPARTGHRHRGTSGWQLRYAAKIDAPLGSRTWAKLQRH